MPSREFNKTVAGAARGGIFIMLLLLTTFDVSSAEGSAELTNDKFRPASFKLASLRSGTPFRTNTVHRSTLADALTETGIITVTDIPGLADLRRSALLGAHLCSKASGAAKTVDMDDGTSRTTLAAVTRGLDSAEDLDLGLLEDKSKCSDEFLSSVSELRSLITEVAAEFVARVGDVFDTSDVALLWNMEGTRKYSSFEDIVRGANHLEHFHTYYKSSSAASVSQMSIDMHADQGLFIAFVPALLVDDGNNDGISSVVEGGNVGEFLIQLKDGTVSPVDFGTGDEVVFMLGDGVEQYFNPKYDGPALRAAPHAMTMPEHEPSQARAWYGRMFLPPDEALNERQGVSFGRARELMIEAVTKGNGHGNGIGCSRKLAEVEQLECADDQMYCWMRCMNHTADANPVTCEEQGMKLKCLSQRIQIWRPEDSHGDYNPTCTDVPDDQYVTPAITIPLRDEATCADGFEDFMGKDEYTHTIELEPGMHWFMWSVKDGLLHAKMAYNGTVGYLAIGPENIGGGRGGMYGSHIVMGIVDPETEDDPAVYGAPFIGTSVKEYIIHESLSAFRHWSEPITPPELQEAGIVTTSCYTAMTFATASVAGVPLNLTEGANNTLIWASHTDTYLKGYHGFYGRGHLNIVLNTGEVTGDDTASDDGITSGAALSMISWVTAAVLGMALATVM